MTEEGMRLRIGGTVEELKAALAEGKRGLTDFAGAADKSGKSASTASAFVDNLLKSNNALGSSLKKVVEDLDAETRAFRHAQAAADGLGKEYRSINQLKEAVKTLRTEAGRADDFTILKEFNRDISLLEREIKRLEGVGAAPTKAVSSFSLLTGEINKSQAAVSAFVAESKKSEFQFNSLQKAISPIAGPSGKLAAMQRSSQSAAAALNGLTRIAQDAPFGFIAIGNNISESILQFGYLVRASGTARGALKALSSALIGPAGVVMGLNLIVTGITVAVQKYGSLGAAIDAILNPLSEQARIQKEVRDTMLQGQKNAQDELAKLQSLYRAATNLNVPLKERNKIADELQKKYPAYFANISNEAILAGKASSAYEKLKEAILAAAQARAAQDKIAEIQAKRLDIQTQLIEKSKELATADRELAKANKEFAAAQKNGTGIGIGAAQALDKYQAAALAAQAKLASTTSAMQSLAKEEKVLINTQNQLIGTIDQFVQQQGATVLGIDPSKGEKIRTISDVLRELKNELGAIDEYNKLVGYSSDRLASEKLTALNKAFEDIAKIGGPGAKEALKKLQEQIDLLGTSVIGDKKLDVKQIFTFDKQKVKDPFSNKETERQVINLPIEFRLDPAALETARANLTNGMKTIVSDAREAFSIEVQQLSNDVSSMLTAFLQNVALQGAVSLSEVIGNAIVGSTDGMKGAISSFLSVLGGYLQNLGKEVIVYSRVLEGIRASIRFGNPYIAAVAGAAAIAAGTALKAYASKMPSFATGGVAIGPQMAVIGDNPGRQEYIIPSEVMDRLGGGGNGFIAETRISGNDLLVLVKKANVNYGRING